MSPDCLQRAIAYVEANLDSRLDWEQIANAIGVPAFVFGRGFKLATGLTPRQYVIRRRVGRAMSLLASSRLGIAEIAFEVGCACQSHLTTLFRKHAGTTPGEFRRASTVASKNLQDAGTPAA